MAQDVDQPTWPAQVGACLHDVEAATNGSDGHSLRASLAKGSKLASALDGNSRLRCASGARAAGQHRLTASAAYINSSSLWSRNCRPLRFNICRPATEKMRGGRATKFAVRSLNSILRLLARRKVFVERIVHLNLASQIRSASPGIRTDGF